MCKKNMITVVTGANSGIGRATALRLAQSGHRVFGTMRSLERGQKLRDLADGLGVEIDEIELDVTNDDSVKKAFDQILTTAGRIDVLVNNAGIGSNAAIEDINVVDDKLVFETNFWGVIRCTQAVLPSMRLTKSGHIIQVSSIAGRVGLPGQPIYSASKWALEGLSENLAHDLATHGIRISIIEPGVTRTAILGKNSDVPTDSAYNGTYQRMFDMYAAGIAANIRPEIVAETIEKCMASTTNQLRWPVAWGAEQMVNARFNGNVSDAEWVALGELVNDSGKWFTEFTKLFRL
jgi:NAD(P)-dependent dehydrogenase (short-subunit alcohol dehydrogenase family)